MSKGIVCVGCSERSVSLQWSEPRKTLAWAMANSLTGRPLGKPTQLGLELVNMPITINGLLPSTTYAFWLVPDDPLYPSPRLYVSTGYFSK